MTYKAMTEKEDEAPEFSPAAMVEKIQGRDVQPWQL